MKHLLTMLALQHTAAVVLKRAAAATPQAFERATGLRVLHMSPAVVVVDKPTGLRSVPAYGPTRALLADFARRQAAGDLPDKWKRSKERAQGVLAESDALKAMSLTQAAVRAARAAARARDDEDGVVAEPRRPPSKADVVAERALLSLFERLLFWFSPNLFRIQGHLRKYIVSQPHPLHVHLMFMLPLRRRFLMIL